MPMERYAAIKATLESGRAREDVLEAAALDPEGWEAEARRAHEKGSVVCVRIPGGFDELRELMGESALCVGYYEQPELIHEILAYFFIVLAAMHAMAAIYHHFFQKDFTLKRMLGFSSPKKETLHET